MCKSKIKALFHSRLWIFQARSEIRYALLYFFTIIEPGDFTVSLSTFSSKDKTDDKDFLNIALEDTNTIKSLLESQVTLNENVLEVCLTCGLRKAYKVRVGKCSFFL